MRGSSSTINIFAIGRGSSISSIQKADGAAILPPNTAYLYNNAENVRKCEQWVNPLEKMPPSCIWGTGGVHGGLRGAAAARYDSRTHRSGYLATRGGVTGQLLVIIIALVALGPGVR